MACWKIGDKLVSSVTGNTTVYVVTGIEHDTHGQRVSLTFADSGHPLGGMFSASLFDRAKLIEDTRDYLDVVSDLSERISNEIP